MRGELNGVGRMEDGGGIFMVAVCCCSAFCGVLLWMREDKGR